MLRLTEIGLILLPLALFVAWRVAGGRDLPARVLAAAGVSVVVLALALAWFGLGRALSPAAPYVPARMAAGGAVVGPH